MNIPNRNSEYGPSESYNLFFAQLTLFRDLISELKPQEELWRVEALEIEANRLALAIEATADAINKNSRASIEFSKTTQKAERLTDLSPMENAGQSLHIMRSYYIALRQIEADTAGNYREPVQSVPIWQTILFWLTVLVTMGLIVQLLILPSAQLINRIIVYNNATQAVANGNWDTAIEGFTFAYTSGPYQDSEAQLINSYRQAVQATLNAEDWEQTRQYAQDLIQLGIADATAQEWIRNSYFVPALNAFDEEDYVETRNQLNNLTEPLDTEAELLYKRSLFQPASAIANSPEPQWDEVETLMIDLIARPEGNTAQSTQIEQTGRELLSQSYTNRTPPLILDEEFIAARDMLAPARTVPLLQVENNAIANILFYESYYANGLALINTEEYEAARDQFTTLLNIAGLSDPYPERSNEQLRLTYYLPGLADLAENDYETARTYFETLIELDAPEAPFRETLSNYYATFYRPAIELLEPDDPTIAPDYEGARATLETMFETDADSVDYLDARDTYYATFYRPAIELLEPDDPTIAPDYEGARVILETMFETDTDSIDYLDAQDTYYATFYRPAIELLEPDDPIASPDYAGARAILEAMFVADIDSVNYLESQTRYYETFYYPALALLEPVNSDIARDYEGARGIFEDLFIIDEEKYGDAADSMNYLSTSEKYYDTFYLPATEILEMDDDLTLADYEEARGLFEQMFDVSPDTIDYQETRNLYFSTYYYPALEKLESNPENNIEADYEGARQLFRFIINYDEISETYEDTLNSYYQTFYDPAKSLVDVEVPDYMGAHTMLQQMFTLDARSRDYPKALELYWDTIYYPALSSYRDEKYLDARGGFDKIMAEDRGDKHRLTERYYLNTFLYNGLDLLNGNESKGIEVDFDKARSEFEELITYNNGDTNAAVSDSSILYLYAETYLRSARQAMESEEYQNARHHLDNLLNPDEDDPIEYTRDIETEVLDLYQQSYLNPAMIALEEERYEEARPHLMDLLDFDHISVTYRNDARVALVRSYTEPAEIAISEERYEDARVLLEDLYLQLDDPSEIIDLLVDVYDPLIRQAITDQSFDTAHTYLTRVIEISPNYRASNEDVLYEFYYSQSEVELDAENWETARVLLIQLTDINPNYKDSQTLLLKTYYSPAVDSLSNGETLGDADQCEAARDEIKLMWEEQSDSGGYKDSRNLVNQTYVCQIKIAIGNNETDTAQSLIVDLLNESPYYTDIEQQFVATYYQPALIAFDEGNYILARTILGNFLPNESIFYDEAFILLREAYYVPAQEALDSKDWETARKEFEDLFEVDENYRDAETLYRESFIQATNDALAIEDWDTARDEINDYLKVDPNDSEASELLKESYFIPAQQAFENKDWDTVLDELDGLEEVDPTFEYQVDQVLAWRILSYYNPEITAYDNKNWGDARQQFKALNDNMLHLRQLSISQPLLADALIDINLLEDDTYYLDSQERYYNTFLIPGVEALEIQNWQTAQDELEALVNLQPDYNNPEISDKIAKELFIDAFLTPGLNAFDDENWTFARSNLRPIIRDHFELATQEQITEARETLLASYHSPAATAIEREDWAIARQYWEEMLVNEAEILTEEEIADVIPRVNQTFMRPINIAIENKTYDVARKALDFALDNAGITEDEYESIRRNTYEIPLNEAITLEDWFSAAELYVELSDIVAVDDVTLLTTFTTNRPLQIALANRFQPFWEDLSLDDIQPLNNDSPILDVAFNANGTQFATVSLNGYLKIWSTGDNTGDTEPSLTVVISSGWFTEVEWEPTTGEWLATANSENDIEIWNAKTGQLITSLTEHQSRITDLLVNEDGNLLISSDEAGEILGWQVSDWSLEPQRFLSDNTLPISAIALSQDNRTLAVALSNEQIILVNTESNTQQYQVESETFVASILFPSDLSYITLGHDTLIRRSFDGTIHDTLLENTDWLRGGEFLLNQQVMMTIDASGTMRIWDANEWHLLKSVSLSLNHVTTLALAPDSQTMVISTTDNGLFVISAHYDTYLSQGE